MAETTRVPPAEGPAPSPAHGRLCLLLAAVLWSTSGAFTKLLTKPTGWGLDQPTLHPLQLACARVLFAGLALLPLLRRRDVSFRPGMVWTALSFAVMNALYVSAMAAGSAAVAVLLQYTAPMWMVLASVWWLREPADRRTPRVRGEGEVIGLTDAPNPREGVATPRGEP
jgi:drug/metabolite transporter (DMT)-like permease